MKKQTVLIGGRKGERTKKTTTTTTTTTTTRESTTLILIGCAASAWREVKVLLLFHVAIPFVGFAPGNCGSTEALVLFATAQSSKSLIFFEVPLFINF